MGSGTYHFIFPFSYILILPFTITLIVKDKSTVFHTDYLLSNNDFLILYKKIMGKEVFEFPSLVNPSSEWLDKMQSDLEYENYISSIRKE